MNNKNSAAKKKARKKASLDALYKDMQNREQAEQNAANGAAPKNGKPVRRAAAKRTTKPAQRQATQPTGQRPAQQANPQQQRAVNKAVNKAVSKNRAKTQKRRGSRGKNFALYYIFAGIVAVVVFSVLAKTVLFDCGTITVSGNLRYSAEEIIGKSGITVGKSLLDIDTEAAQSGIVASLAYIDSAEVKKSYPTRIEITVKEAERWFAVRDGSRSYIISRMGKIIEQGTDDSLPVIIGYDAKDAEVGIMLISDEDGKTELPALIMSAAEEAQIKGITTIDISDRFEIIVTVEDRVTLQLGLSSQLENKLHIARELIENEISETEYVTVNLTNPEKVYVRDNNLIDNPVEVPVLPQESAESAESGDSSSDEA